MGAQFNSHLKTMTQESFDLLKPLLESQSYFNEVKCSLYTDPDPEILIDLDDFRHHFAKTIRDNYIACYFHSFKQQFTHEDTLPWMTIDNPIRIKPIVCSRTSRYRCPNGDQILKQLANEMNFKDNAVFLGTEEEYEDYKRVTNCNLLYHPVQDFLETARIIKGADQFIGNQTFTYSLAIAMGQATILETNKQTSLDQNECYFVRKNCRYF